MADYYDGQMTLMGITDHAAKVTFNATLRPGYTREMLHDTIESYCAFIVAIREGVRQLEPRWAVKHWPDSDTFLINLWDSSKGSHGMNFFTEHSTAQSALDFYWQCKDDLAAIDLARVLEVANEGEQPATLQPENGTSGLQGDFQAYQPDTPYPVPTIVERKGLRIALQNGELPTMQAAVASRKRHNPFGGNDGFYGDSAYGYTPELDKD